MKWRREYSILLPILLVGCSDLIYEYTDPAVRLATCVESGANLLINREQVNKLDVECDSSQEGDYVVIFVPPKIYTDEQLINNGLSIETIRKLKLHTPTSSPHGMIYVIPLFTQELGSHSAAFGKHVTINNFSMAIKNKELVKIELTKHDDNTINISHGR